MRLCRLTALLLLTLVGSLTARSQVTISGSGKVTGAAQMSVNVGTGGGGSFINCGVPPLLPCTTGWYQIPNSAFSPLCPSYAEIQGTTGCSAVVQAWGGALADTTRNRMIVWGGGHTDYKGNEVYELNLAASPPAWVLARDATHNPNLSGGACPETNADGTPTSRHTYAGLEMTNSTYFMFGSGCLNGSYSNQMWILNPTTFTWTEPAIPGTHPNPASNGSQGAYVNDSVTGNLYYYEGNAGNFWSYNEGTNTYTLLESGGASGSGCFFQNFTPAIDPVRRLYFCVGGGNSANNAYKVSMNSPYTLTAIAMTGCGSMETVNAPGFEYDPQTGNFVGWYGGNTVYTYNPDTDSCTSQVFTGGPPAPTCNDGNGQQCEGTYKRFRFFPALGVFALVNDYSQNAYVLRTQAPNDSNFNQRCFAPGVISCEGFDTVASFNQATSPNSGLYYQVSCQTWPTPCIERDTTNKVSGASSIKWDIYQTGSVSTNDEGGWYESFGCPIATTCSNAKIISFAQNSTFYAQVAFRADTAWATTQWEANPGPATSPKIFILHGSQNGSANSCSAEEITNINSGGTAAEQAYTDCGLRALYTNLDGVTPDQGGSLPFLLQQGFTDPTPGYDCENANGNPQANGAGNHPSPLTPGGSGLGCFIYQSNTWYTIYYVVHIGTWGANNSSIFAYIAPYGQPLKKFINIVNGSLNQDNSNNPDGYNMMELTQFMTGKQACTVGTNCPSVAHVNYDEMVVSKNPIVDPSTLPH